MKLSMTLKFSPGYAGLEMDLVWEAERLGFDAVWAGEAYGTDAVSPVAWGFARTTLHKPGLRRDDRDDLAGAFRQPVPVRHWPLRAAGCRGLARRAVRPPIGAHPR